METLPQHPAFEFDAAVSPSWGEHVTLADGRRCDISAISPEEILRLQWEQEQAFARRILETNKGSAARAEATRVAYDTVTRIFARCLDTEGSEAPSMGLDPRYVDLVLRLLRSQQARDGHARLFEVGFGSGRLLEAAAEAGFSVGGIEVSPALHAEAERRLPEHARADLRLGSLPDLGRQYHGRPFTLVYWNDVFEHVPPDEILDYLGAIHRLLAPGGCLLTFTPNWHFRPSDVTRAVCKPRTEAAGLHLKEYTLGQVRSLLGEAGFTRVRVPLLVTKKRIVLAGSGLAGWKCRLEPLLEWLPFRMAEILCRGFGLSCTIAMKSR